MLTREPDVTIDPKVAFVEIVAKKKGCMMCDLAVAILEEIEPEFEEKNPLSQHVYQRVAAGCVSR